MNCAGCPSLNSLWHLLVQEPGTCFGAARIPGTLVEASKFEGFLRKQATGRGLSHQLHTIQTSRSCQPPSTAPSGVPICPSSAVVAASVGRCKPPSPCTEPAVTHRRAPVGSPVLGCVGLATTAVPVASSPSFRSRVTTGHHVRAPATTPDSVCSSVLSLNRARPVSCCHHGCASQPPDAAQAAELDEAAVLASRGTTDAPLGPILTHVRRLLGR